MHDFHKNLRSLRQQHHLTQSQMADALGVSPSRIGMYEQGRRDPDLDMLQKIAKFFSVSTDSLLGISPSLTAAGYVQMPYAMTQIPVLGRVSAGLPLYAEQQIDGYIQTDLTKDGEEYFALRVKGDSMSAARIQEGDLVIVRRQPEVENGEIAVVMVAGESATIKRYHREPDTPIVTLTPQSYNPVHKPQIYDLRKTDISILGRVIRVQIDL